MKLFAPIIPKISLLALIFSLFLIGPLNGIAANKKTGFMGDPAKKRGVEYGFDKGYSAGKKDKDAGLKPDPKRHEDFNDPEKYYRYEFGSRAGFISGFKGGFVGGYQKAYGKKVKVVVPGLYEKAPEGDEAAKAPPATKPPDAANDAL